MAIDQLKERLKFEKNKSNKEKLSNNSSKILTVKEKVIEEIKKIYDPEIPVNIYELGLIYNIIIDEVNNVKIDMTLTSPNCPVAESLPNEVKNSVKEIKEIKDVDLNLVWDPPWNKDMMSEAAKLELNI